MFWFFAILFLGLLAAVRRFVPTYILVVFILAGFVVALSVRPSWLVNPFIRYVGKVSYSAYLVHFAALGISLRLLGIHLTPELTHFDAGTPLRNLLLFFKIIAIALPLTLVISTLTLHLMENPGVALGRKIIQRITALSGVP